MLAVSGCKMVMSDVTYLNKFTTLDIPPDRVLEGAIGKMDEVIVIGWDEEEEFYMAFNKSNIGGLLHLIEIAKKQLLESE